MLNRTELLKAFDCMKHSLFPDTTYAYALAQKTWALIVDDPLFRSKIAQAYSAWSLPSWKKELNEIKITQKKTDPYRIISVDGSQIYPDRHQGASCFLINTGSVMIAYGTQQEKPVMVNSKPYLFSEIDNNQYKSGNMQEVINCRRQQLELQEGYDLAAAYLSSSGDDQLLLFDGALVFWNLEAKDTVLRELFLDTYLKILTQLYNKGLLYAGYISAPKSRELMSLIKLSLCNFNSEDEACYSCVEHVVDSAALAAFLTPHTRTIVFANHAEITGHYPSYLRPHFFYLHVGSEIARIEIPAWVAENDQLVDTIASIILDQVFKGSGYPVVIAEAHEQAVIKGDDRDFFYYALQKIGISHNQKIMTSPKLNRKRSIGI